MQTMTILKQYADGAVLKWNNSIWAIKPDGDSPTLYPVALISTDPSSGAPKITIPRGTDVDAANAVLSTLNIPNLF
jgi:hypothetical protein